MVLPLGVDASLGVLNLPLGGVVMVLFVRGFILFILAGSGRDTRDVVLLENRDCYYLSQKCWMIRLTWLELFSELLEPVSPAVLWPDEGCPLFQDYSDVRSDVRSGVGLWPLDVGWCGWDSWISPPIELLTSLSVWEKGKNQLFVRCRLMCEAWMVLIGGGEIEVSWFLL